LIQARTPLFQKLKRPVLGKRAFLFFSNFKKGMFHFIKGKEEKKTGKKKTGKKDGKKDGKKTGKRMGKEKMRVEKMGCRRHPHKC